MSRAIGPYRVLEPLGRGGTGIVLRCVHEATGESVALKTAQHGKAEDCQALRREAGILSRLGRSRIRRSEEHTSELQSRENLVCRLLLEKKKQEKRIKVM